MKRQYPNLTIVYFPFEKKHPYALYLKTKTGVRLIARGYKTIEQAQQEAQEWADDLHIPIYQQEIQVP